MELNSVEDAWQPRMSFTLKLQGRALTLLIETRLAQSAELPPYADEVQP
jgi:hypothetical protein